MSEINNVNNSEYAASQLLTEISMPNPGLNDVQFADSLENVFSNINDNFVSLANREFIKGDAGKSVEVISVDLFYNNNVETPSYYGNKLMQAITNKIEDLNEPASISINGNTLNIFDNLKKLDSDGKTQKIQLIYNVDNETLRANSADLSLGSKIESSATAVSSLYFVFLDGRFANEHIGSDNTDQFSNLTDLSGIYIYQYDKSTKQDEFISLNNAFPTISYKDGVGLCWKVNGSETGIPVQGVPGKDGSNASLMIVQSEPLSDAERIGEIIEGEVVGVYESYSGYRPIEEYPNLSSFDNQSALILCPDENDTNKFYFGKLKLKDEILYAYCDPATSINSAISSQNIINVFKSIDIFNNGQNISEGLKGLFIPIAPSISSDTTEAHLISASSIAGTGASSDKRTDIIFTPISDIDSINLLEGKKLGVEKYLYLKIDNNHNIFSKNDVLNINYLKYKLTGVITNIDDLEEYVKYKYGSFNNSSILLSSDNTVCVNNDGDVVSINESIPENFKSRLNSNIGIYRWTLQDEYNEFDVDELKAYRTSTDEGYTYEYGNGERENYFMNIFTTTISPSAESHIMWFNGMEIVNDEVIDDKYAISGWSNYSESPYSFIQFIPIYDISDEYQVNYDTALSLNYNVNITGDENNPKKGLTVHGDINCDNLSAFNNISAKEIANVNTSNDIISKSGIYVGCDNFDDIDTAKGFIGTGGSIKGTSLSVGESFLESDNFTVKNIDSKKIITDQIVLNTSNNAISESAINIRRSNSIGGAVDADLTKLHKVVVQSKDKTAILSGYTVPTSGPYEGIALSDNPADTDYSSSVTSFGTHFNNNGHVVISNQPNYSQNVFIKNSLKTYSKNDLENKTSGYNYIIYHPGNGVCDTDLYISEPSFDNAKNFNMHRMSLQGTASSEKTSEATLSNTTSSPKYLSSKTAGEGSQSISISTPKNNWSFKNSDSGLTDTIKAINYNYIQKINIPKTGDKKISGTNIEINFDKTLAFNIGLNGKCSYGNWPMLKKLSVTLCVFGRTSDQNENITVYEAQTYTNTDFCTSSTSEETNSWVGVKEDGSSFGKDYDYAWRYYSFVFKPYTINYPVSKIEALFNDYNKGIELYVVPVFNIEMHCQKSKALIKDIKISNVFPVNTSNTASSTAYIYKSSTYYPVATTNSPSEAGSTKYSLTSTVAGEDKEGIKSTVLCNDGVVMRAGNYVFGLGYADTIVDHTTGQNGNYLVKNSSSNPHWNSNDFRHNVPVLFYHQHDSRYYGSNGKPNGSTTTLQGYAERSNAIPLDELFNAIRALRATGTLQYGL